MENEPGTDIKVAGLLPPAVKCPRRFIVVHAEPQRAKSARSPIKNEVHW